LLFGIGGLLAELAGGYFDVLLGERVGDVESGKAAGGEAAGSSQRRMAYLLSPEVVRLSSEATTAMS